MEAHGSGRRCKPCTCSSNNVTVVLHASGIQQSRCLWFLRHGRCNKTPANSFGFGHLRSSLRRYSLPSWKTKRTSSSLILHISPRRISETKPNANMSAICLLNHTFPLPQFLVMNFTMVSVKPADYFLVHGSFASAPSTTAEIFGSSLSEGRPTLILAAESTILAERARVTPVASCATVVIK